MKLGHRFLIVLIVVAVALAVQGALMAHLSRASVVVPGQLSAKLAQFPYRLGDWVGIDQKIEENLKYGDDHLQRVYQNTTTGQQVALWMIYSSEGKDREHHPEVCMKARGLPEDASARKTVDAPGHAKPVQQYCYGHVGEQQLVYYWHYRLPSQNAEQLDTLQLWYRNSRHPPASITAEVFAPQQSGEGETGANEFMLAVDAALQPLVGERAQRNHDRKPVSLTLETEPPAPPATK